MSQATPGSQTTDPATESQGTRTQGTRTQTTRAHPATARRTLALFWSAAARYPWRLLAALTVPVLTVLSARFVGPYVISVLLTQIQAGTVTWDTGWPLVLGYGLSQLFGQVVGWRIVLFAVWSLQAKAMRDLFERTFDHLTAQSLGFHADRFSGALVAQANKLTSAFERFWDAVVWQVIPVATTVVAAVTILAFVLPGYAVFLLGMTAGFTVFVVLSARRLEQLNVREAQASTRMTGFLADVMTNIVAVKSAGAEVREQGRARSLAGGWHDDNLRLMRSFLGFSTGYSAVIAIINTGAVLAAVSAAEQQLVSVAAVYLATAYTLAVTDQLWEITQVMREYNRVLGDAHDMVAVLGLAPTVVDTSEAVLVPGAGAVRFDRVGFTHEGAGDRTLFTDFTLDIRPGEKIGLVGHSGSGKSTLVRLLLRFSDVDSGAIRIDGQDLRDVTQASLRRAIAYVPQEPLLFHRSIGENISYCRPAATDAQIRWAAARASADEFIAELPQGYATLVGERGVKLSGGQRQRVAIARAVLADSGILVLDEATSALDSQSEGHIQAALTEAMRGRTTIVIAHRLSTVQAMDRIVVLAEGRIVEQGSHPELLAAGGVYAGLWAHQSGGFLG